MLGAAYENLVCLAFASRCEDKYKLSGPLKISFRRPERLWIDFSPREVRVGQ